MTQERRKQELASIEEAVIQMGDAEAEELLAMVKGAIMGYGVAKKEAQSA